jgi:hypothetical protein
MTEESWPPQVPVVEKEGERFPEDFPYQEHDMEMLLTAAGGKKIYVKVCTTEARSD